MKPLRKSSSPNPSLPETHTGALSEDRLNMLSHELRTPLAIIAGYSDILEEEAGNELEHLTRPIRDAISRMQHVVDALIEYEETRLPLKASRLIPVTPPKADGSRIPLDHLVGRMVQKVQRRYPDSAVHVLLQVSDAVSLPPDLGDALAKALNHVLDNAFKFANASIRVSTEERDGQLSIRIQDDGPGLPSSSVAVFAPFQQGTGGLSREQAGLGMGLFLAKRSLGQISGRIKLNDNGEEAGTTAVISVPLPAHNVLRRAA